MGGYGDFFVALLSPLLLLLLLLCFLASSLLLLSSLSTPSASTSCIRRSLDWEALLRARTVGEFYKQIIIIKMLATKTIK